MDIPKWYQQSALGIRVFPTDVGVWLRFQNANLKLF